MEQVVAILIALILLLLPFFYLAKAIFFFTGEPDLKYRSIYIRTVIYGLVAIILIGFYFSVPAMMFKMETVTKNAPVGAFAGINRNDTIVLDGLQLKHRFADFPMNNYSSTYILSTAASDQDIWGKVKNGFSHYLLGNKPGIENGILTLNYPVRDAYYKVQPNKKTKKNQPNPVPQNSFIINRYYLSLRSDTLLLAPFTNPSVVFRYLRFANHY